MPETIIGFFPDVAATYLLSRAPGEVGTHMALTGATVTGADAVHVGLADAVVDHTRLPELIAAVAGGGPIEPVPAGAMTKGGDLASSHGWVDECYAGDDAAVILARLREHADPAARAAAEEISLRSPLSVAVTLAALRRAATAGSVREVLEADTRISRGLLARADFVEGVRALLVDKDRQPRWEHADVDEVTRSEVMSVLEG